MGLLKERKRLLACLFLVSLLAPAFISLEKVSDYLARSAAERLMGPMKERCVLTGNVLVRSFDPSGRERSFPVWRVIFEERYVMSEEVNVDVDLLGHPVSSNAPILQRWISLPANERRKEQLEMEKQIGSELQEKDAH